MNYDPAWDMPLRNWQQQGSFQQAILPPSDGPLDATLVCLPPINQDWLPIVLGCLDQLCNPSSWFTTDDDALNTVLEQAESLKQAFGERADCMSLAIRFDADSCQLQQSTDAGATWTEVDGWSDFTSCLPPQTTLQLTDTCALQESYDAGVTWQDIAGWDENWVDCVQSAGEFIGLPPNPGDQAPNELACSIATFLANQIILDAMQAGVTAIQDDITLLAFGAQVLTIIPEFVLVKLGYDAVSIIYTEIAEGTLSDYEDAIADGSLWLSVSCAIFSAIVGQGQVDAFNFSTILANIDAISYAHSDVIAAIHDYVSSLGANGLAQLSQRAGLETGADCSSCTADTWCYHFSIANGELEARWSPEGGSYVLDRLGYSPMVGAWDATHGWISDLDPIGGSRQSLGIGVFFPMSWITEIDISVHGGDGGNGGTRIVAINEYALETALSQSSGDVVNTVPIGNYATSIQIEVDTNITPANNNWIYDIVVTGLGVCPFGTPNC